VRTDIIKRLIPPGSYEIPAKETDDSDPEPIIDRKGKGVAGRPSLSRVRSSSTRKDPSALAGSGKAGGKRPQPKKLPLLYIREIVICGYWNQPKEEHSDEYFLPNDGDVREHTPFIDALEALLWSIDRLESFQWVPPPLLWRCDAAR
jgi:hypothetical protein